MSDPSMTEQLDLMEQAWSSIDELVADVGPDDWDRPTDCPGWSVKDVLSHMAGGEDALLGRPRPEVEVSGPHLRNEMGMRNEQQVEVRRARTGSGVVDEWRAHTAERLDVMRSWGADDWDVVTWAPPGEMPRRQALRFRIFDAWVHEQDMRRAVGRPGHMNGAVARYSYDMMTAVMPYVVGKKAAVPDGTTVVFDLSGGPARPFAIEMRGGRAEPADSIPTRPTARLSMDFETFACLACGRWSAERALDEARVKVEGDQEIGRRVLDNMNFVP